MDTALPVVLSLPEATVGAVTLLVRPAVTTLLPVMAVATSHRHLPATVSAHPRVEEEVVVEEVVSRTTAAAVEDATDRPHRDAPCLRPTNIPLPAVAAAAATAVATTIHRLDVVVVVVAVMRMIHMWGPTEGLAAGGITMNPIEGVR